MKWRDSKLYLIGLLGIIICVSFFFWGWWVGKTYTAPIEVYDNYKAGRISFCELTETDRLKVCPALRRYAEIETGGSLTVYVCDKDSNGFIETKNLSEESKTIVNSDIQLMKQKHGLKITKICDTESKTVFRVTNGGRKLDD